jgi:hypothetical protein
LVVVALAEASRRDRSAAVADRTESARFVGLQDLLLFVIEVIHG